MTDAPRLFDTIREAEVFITRLRRLGVSFRVKLVTHPRRTGLPMQTCVTPFAPVGGS